MPKQLALPGIDTQAQYTCPLCREVRTLFGQYSPIQDWWVCRECSIAHPYPVELLVPSTRRNRGREPLMIDPAAEFSAQRDLRMELDEMMRCAYDPQRADLPVAKYNVTGLALRHGVRRSRMQQLNNMARQAAAAARAPQQMRLNYCERCGCAHDRHYVFRDGQMDYWSRCQRCEDEVAVEALYRVRAIFGDDDAETILDRIQRSQPELFERGVLPDYWYQLARAS